VVLASRIYLPEPAAASYRLAGLVEALAHEGAQVDVLTTSAPPALRTQAHGPTRDPRIRIRRFPVLRDRAGYVRGYLQYLSYDLPLVARLLTVRRPDVVVCEPPPTTGAVVRAVCALRRIPYVYYAADIWSDAAGNAAPGAVVDTVRSVERGAIRRASAVLSVSDAVTQRLLPWRTDGVTTVGHGIDTTVFRPAPGGPGDPPYFLYAGTASEVHGATIFVEAFRRVRRDHPRTRLVFAGQGTDVDAFASAAADLPAGAVTVLPRQDAAATASLIRGAVASLASVRPSMNYDYAVPTKAYASLACGVPVILAGPSPLAAAVQETGLGWAVPYDVAAVAGAMQAALDRPGPAEDAARIAAWADEHASGRQVAQRAADVVLTAAAGG
jgi:glycosyltransferase involved in cell wall biosynthesis